MARTQRDIVLLMAREIDPTDAPEDAEYISEWEPGHTVCGGQGDPGCSGCWMHDYDAREPSDYDGHCPTCDAPEPTHTPTCAVVNIQVAETSSS